MKAVNAEWNAANPERRKAHGAAWDAANIVRRKARNAAWSAANLDLKRAHDAERYAANPERAKTNAAAWTKANIDAKRIHTQNRSARKRKNGGILSKGLSTKLFKLQRGKCACCGLPLGTNFHMDHIMPIDLGGPNVDGNMQLLRQRCNLQKSAKHPIEFMQQRGFLL